MSGSRRAPGRGWRGAASRGPTRRGTFAPREPDDDETPLELVLDLLAAVPAGKLAIAHLPVVTPRETQELEEAGCDAVIATTRNIAALAGDLPPDV